MAAVALQDSAPATLHANKILFSKDESALLDMLVAEGQEHLFTHWPELGHDDDKKKAFVQQIAKLDGSYNGGLQQYIANARQLLEDSRLGKNPLEGFIPSVPDGTKLDFGSEQYQQLEEVGVGAAAATAFVLVAGGLGERLGYSGIKVALPSETARGACFLQVYIESILALQRKGSADVKLPLAIMTSDDTHARTQQLLEQHAFFGMEPDQVTLIKQEKVPCLSNNDAHLALDAKDPYLIQTKPHGHGDVHALLHSSGLAKRWASQGLKWVAFFQDTNALVFRGLVAALGVSAREDYDMNSLAVPRKAKEAIGGIALLRKADSSEQMTVNVEYNQLDPLLRATVNPEGDVNDASGYSPFPGNINQLVLKLSSYVEQLERTGGVIGEFVNPKYTDSSKTAFKSSTRLECMMQDYPKSLPPTAKVGFTVINQVWAAYSPVKNSPSDAKAKAAAGNPSHSATSGELDLYRVHASTLQLCGVDVGGYHPAQFNGLQVEVGPIVVWSPLWAVTFADVKAKLGLGPITLSGKSALVLNNPDARIESLQLDGALVVDAAPQSQNNTLTIGGGKVNNEGWEVVALNPDASATEEEYIRGFRIVRHATKLLLPGEQ